MHFRYTRVPEWPPLAWLARCQRSKSSVAVLHGSRVEVTEDWFCEAVWAGAYESGDFDQTDIIAGSGGRLREERIIFVSSGSTVDRLQSMQVGDSLWVLNSLPCLLTAIEATLDSSYSRYYQDLYSIVHGFDKYQRCLTTSAGPVYLTYFNNLTWDGQLLTPQSKPGEHLNLTTFARYKDFLEA